MGPAGRLDSWKAIAAYLKRDERTVRRWEKEGLPVHRHLHAKKASVYAYPSEIDSWWSEGRTHADAQAVAPSRRRVAWLLAVGSLLLGVGAGWFAFGDRVFERPALGEITSIAVLPLANLSGDPQEEYFADGMTEALIGELGKVSALRVTSRTSVMAYKNTKKTLPQVARELNVDALVEGAVVREGGRIRVSAQLIRTKPERRLWGENYERELSSILGLHRDVARMIAAEIRVTLTAKEKVLLSGARAVNAASYEAYLKGRYHWNKASGAALLKARQYFEEAIAQDPGFAPAYADLANTYAWAYRWDAPSLLPPLGEFQKAKAAVQKAMELDDTLAEAHAALACIREAGDWDWDGAEQAYRRAIELNPNYASARHWYALHLASAGRFDEAFAQMKRAEELDPLSRAIRRGKGWLHLWSRDFDRAIEQWRMTLELEPDFPQAHYALALAFAHKGMYGEAIASHRQGIALAGETPRALAILANAYGRAGQKGRALQILGDLNERGKREYVSGYLVAIGYLGLGDKDEVFRSLERAFRERDPYLAELRPASLWFDEVRSDARFKELLRRLGLAA